MSTQKKIIVFELTQTILLLINFFFIIIGKLYVRSARAKGE